jgi:anti-sigma factor RsiW
MNEPRHVPRLPATPCRGDVEEALNLYLDGELSFAAQPALFQHLASCEACRRTMAAMLEFRRMSRQESIAVPAAADEAIFQQLERVKRRDERIDRAADRRPLWQARMPISLRAATTMALLLFLAGLFFPQAAGEPLPRPRVESVEERVEFAPAVRGEAVYVFYPGLTIEASRLHDPTEKDPL